MLFLSQFDLNSEENRFSKKSLLFFGGVSSYVNRFMNISTKLILLISLNELDSISIILFQQTERRIYFIPTRQEILQLRSQRVILDILEYFVMAFHSDVARWVVLEDVVLSLEEIALQTEEIITEFCRIQFLFSQILFSLLLSGKLNQ